MKQAATIGKNELPNNRTFLEDQDSDFMMQVGNLQETAVRFHSGFNSVQSGIANSMPYFRPLLKKLRDEGRTDEAEQILTEFLGIVAQAKTLFAVVGPLTLPTAYQSRR